MPIVPGVLGFRAGGGDTTLVVGQVVATVSEEAVVAVVSEPTIIAVVSADAFTVTAP